MTRQVVNPEILMCEKVLRKMGKRGVCVSVCNSGLCVLPVFFCSISFGIEKHRTFLVLVPTTIFMVLGHLSGRKTSLMVSF